jgi:hypothetical protein
MSARATRKPLSGEQRSGSRKGSLQCKTVGDRITMRGRIGRLATCALAGWLGVTAILASASAAPRRTPVPLQSSHAPALAEPRFEERDFTPWLPNRVLIEQLKRHPAPGKFPAYIEGRAENYAVEFRAALRPKPKGFLTWEARWNVTEPEFEALHQRYAQRGFILYSRSEFAGLEGDTRLNGVWIKVRE